MRHIMLIETPKNKQLGLLKAGLTLAAIVTSLSLPLFVKADSYTVQSGDTLSAIANKYQTTVEQVASENKISNINLISVGQVLNINNSTTVSTETKVETESVTTTSTTVTTSTPSTSSLSASDAAAKEVIAQRESSGSYTAQNGQYYGRYQLTLSYLNGDLSPENQERVADAYVTNRYGSWSAALAFWNVNGWY